MSAISVSGRATLRNLRTVMVNTAPGSEIVAQHGHGDPEHYRRRRLRLPDPLQWRTGKCVDRGINTGASILNKRLFVQRALV